MHSFTHLSALVPLRSMRVAYKMVGRLMLTVLCSLVSKTSVAGPLGLEMGMSIEQLKTAGVDVTDYKDGVLWSDTVPKPHRAFSRYVLIVDPQLGLCKMAALGRSIEMNSFGSQLQEEFQNVLAALESNYGRAAQFDFLRRGSIWNESKDWSISLLKEERTLMAAWPRDETDSRYVLKDNVVAISLEASAIKTSVGYVTVQYEFKNAKACLAKRKKRRDSVL